MKLRPPACPVLGEERHEVVGMIVKKTVMFRPRTGFSTMVMAVLSCEKMWSSTDSPAFGRTSKRQVLREDPHAVDDRSLRARTAG